MTPTTKTVPAPDLGKSHKRRMDAVLDVSSWSCIAASTFDGDDVETIKEDEIGKREMVLELRLPRIIERGDGYGFSDAKCPNKPIADALAAALNGRVISCAGGPFTNSWLINIKVPVEDGMLLIDQRLDNLGQLVDDPSVDA